MPRRPALAALAAAAALLACAPFAAAGAAEPAAAGLPAEMLKRHMEFPGCTDPADEIMPKGDDLGFRARLDEGSELVGILCDGGASYNAPYAIYIVREGLFADAERKYFADYALETGWYGSSVLYNASFDVRSGLLRGFAKASGFGDCGSQTALKWDGNDLAMVEFRFKQDCDGRSDRLFPLIYSRRGGGR